MGSDARAVRRELFRCFQLARTRSEIPIRKEDAPEEMMRLRILRIGAGRLPRQGSGFGDFSSLQIDRGECDQRGNMVRRGIQFLAILAFSFYLLPFESVERGAKEMHFRLSGEIGRAHV